jgi:hypothetical protein
MLYVNPEFFSRRPSPLKDEVSGDKITRYASVNSAPFFFTQAFRIRLSVHNEVEYKNYSVSSAASVRIVYAPPGSAFN